LTTTTHTFLFTSSQTQQYYTNLFPNTILQNFTTLYNTFTKLHTLNIFLHNSTQQFTTLRNLTRRYTTIHNFYKQKLFKSFSDKYTTPHIFIQLHTTLQNKCQKSFTILLQVFFEKKTITNATTVYTTLHNTLTIFHQTLQTLYTTFINKKHTTTLQHLQKLHKTIQTYTKLYRTKHNYTKLYNYTQPYKPYTQLYKTLYKSTQFYKALQNFTNRNFTILYTPIKTLHKY